MGLPINRVPPGLLSLLDAKNSGVNPLQLADDLVGTVQLGEQYLAASAQLLYGPCPAAAAVGRVEPNAGDLFRANAGQLLVCSYITGYTNAAFGAGITARFRLVMFDYTLGYNVWSGPAVTGAATEQPIASTDRVLFVPPGYGVGIQVEQIAGGALTFAVRGLCTTLRI